MIRYVFWLVLSLAVELVAIALSGVLPYFAKARYGWSDNRHRQVIEPRLPWWLAWFDTPDNSLWGDSGWRTIHCPHYKTRKGMAQWLRRNHGYGFKWTAAAAEVTDPVSIQHSGDPDINLNDGKPGVFKARMGKYWQHKSVRPIPGTGYSLALNAGWLLDMYVTHPLAHLETPKALFMFSPGFVKTKQ